jgi:hypothetical protein
MSTYEYRPTIHGAWLRVGTERNHCDSCGAELTPVIDGHSQDENSGGYAGEQYEDALVVHVEGGYGMYVDDVYGQLEHRVLLCAKCADRLTELFPCILRPTPAELLRRQSDEDYAENENPKQLDEDSSEPQKEDR